MPPTEINNVWASNAPSTIGETRTLPSGQTCRARRVSIEDLVDMGILEQADSLTAIVDTKHVRKVRGGKGADELDMKSLLADHTAMRSILMLADKALPVIVLDPPVALHYVVEDTGQAMKGKPVTRQRMLMPEERAELVAARPGLVFTDQIDLVDKMDLFNWAMGDMAGLAAFRGHESGDAVATVEHVPGVSRSAKRARRAASR